jgi:PA domain
MNPSPNVLLALFILSFSVSAIFHRSQLHSGSPVFAQYAADVFVPSTNDTFVSRPATFGALFDDVFRGELIKAWGDGFACQNASGDIATEVAGRMVLVERGHCAFVDKVRRIQNMGGIAVIVGDNIAQSGLLTMYASGTLSFDAAHFRGYLGYHYSLHLYRSCIVFVSILPSLPPSSSQDKNYSFGSLRLASTRYPPSCHFIAFVHVGMHLHSAPHPSTSPTSSSTSSIILHQIPPPSSMDPRKSSRGMYWRTI